MKVNWGFYLDNKLNALDTAGEWYFDSTARRIYVWPKAGHSLSTTLATVRDSGVEIGSNRNNVVIQNVQVQRQVRISCRCEFLLLTMHVQTVHSVRVNFNARNIILRNLSISFSGYDGIHCFQG